MTIPASGVVKMSDIRTEYMPIGSNAMVELSAFYKGGASGFVKNTGVGNTAVNGSDGLPTSGPIKLSDFRGKTAGWIFTNSIVREDYVMSTPFGTDWNVDWPKTLINNSTIGGTHNIANVYWALRIQGGAGKLFLINNSEIQGAYGVINSGPGYHAIYIGANSRVYITNNGAIRGGGGAGGAGGAGGTGGSGQYTAQDGPRYNGSNRVENQPSWVETGGQGGGSHNEPGNCEYIWDGNKIFDGSPGRTSFASGIYTWYRGTLRFSGGGGGAWDLYEIYVQWTQASGGGGGGGGGNGGYGQGYGYGGSTGSAGAGGAAGGPNAGAGGAGGTGGNGGTWGTAGANGANGAGGGWGNVGGWGSAGGGGGGGGAAGYAVHADTAWTKLVEGTMQGPQAPVVAS